VTIIKNLKAVTDKAIPGGEFTIGWELMNGARHVLRCHITQQTMVNTYH
jgi:hypothetical protein